MSWCPICKNEYVEGIKVCSDCNVDLVEELEEKRAEPITFGSEEEMMKLNDFLRYNQVLSGTIEYNEEEQIHEIFVDRKDTKKAKKLVHIFLQEESLLENEELEHIEEKNILDTSKAQVYEYKSERAENFKTSAYTLLLVGVAGLVLLILTALKIISLQFGILTYIVMGFLFVLFIIMGIFSYHSYKKIALDAVTENNLTKEIKAWCLKNLTADMIDKELMIDELAEEMKYFKRTEQIKKLISETFINLEEGFLDAIIEDLYTVLFE